MAEMAKKKATYQDLYDIPENTTGEIVDGKLVVHPRPSRKHIYTASRLNKRLSPYEFGEGGGPGGWIILVEPEIQLGEHTMVPDLAGWKRERFPVEEETNSISVVPDWVCEIISSPQGELYDRGDKMPIYAEHGVPHAWLVNPAVTSLEAYRLESGRWSTIGVLGGKKKVRVEPFQEIELDLGDLWL